MVAQAEWVAAAMMKLEVENHGIAAVDEDDTSAAYPVARVLTSTVSAMAEPNIGGGARVLVEVLRRFGGIAPRALLGAEFLAGSDPAVQIEIAVAPFDLLDGADQPTCPSRLWTRPFTSGLPTDMADAVLRGLTAEPRIALPPGVLRVDRAGFDVMNSSEPIFTQAATVLRIAISAKLLGNDPEPALRDAIQTW
jgi:hypothetical protein